MPDRMKELMHENPDGGSRAEVGVQISGVIVCDDNDESTDEITNDAIPSEPGPESVDHRARFLQ